MSPGLDDVVRLRRISILKQPNGPRVYRVYLAQSVQVVVQNLENLLHRTALPHGQLLRIAAAPGVGPHLHAYPKPHPPARCIVSSPKQRGATTPE
jgi:hypothetical protein